MSWWSDQTRLGKLVKDRDDLLDGLVGLTNAYRRLAQKGIVEEHLPLIKAESVLGRERAT